MRSSSGHVHEQKLLPQLNKVVRSTARSSRDLKLQRGRLQLREHFRGIFRAPVLVVHDSPAFDWPIVQIFRSLVVGGGCQWRGGDVQEQG